MRIYESEKWYHVFPWFWLFLVISLIGVFTLASYAFAIQNRRSEIASNEARSQGCELIGHARDLSKVYFMNCDGQVKMIYVDDY